MPFGVLRLPIELSRELLERGPGDWVNEAGRWSPPGEPRPNSVAEVHHG